MAATVNPSVVRAWAEAEGLVKPGQRGRLSAPVIKEYNKTHGAKYSGKGKFVRTVEVKAKPEKGRTVTKKVDPREVRAAAVAAGVSLPARGRLPESVKQAYVLGTLGQ
jgi:hypothetical protein